MGLGKNRTKFGQVMDQNGYKQSDLPVNKNTATRLCNELDYDPPPEIQTTAIGFLRKKGHDVRPGDFWA
ncbi:hypothetical protein BCM02_1176 [Paenibacillus methanolicus]|uniref:Uncharacterized protein n=1 Tax=Paenibacillus methanolicus TaxID=582686 RepID=A0A5S5BR92_9BACL|nr:hypothetical protein BCM02_1176 [Paenibacillus methanolicus]